MDATINRNNQALFQKIITFLNGEFDNFQQAWQENTEEDIHRVEVAEKHRHVHTIFEKHSTSSVNNMHFVLNHYENRNSRDIVDQHYLSIVYNPEENTLISEFKNAKFPTEIITWELEEESIKGTASNNNTSLFLEGNQLIINQKEGFFQNSAPYKMIKCRFFSGFIEIPNPENPDVMIRMGDLKLHDQGDMVQFAYEDGTKGAFIVELTQLVFAKRLAIMKLGIYEELIEDIHYSSRAMSYTWTNPDAKRIGINLRKMLTGWTYIEPGFVSSNNMDLEK